jgi:serine protease Do
MIRSRMLSGGAIATLLVLSLGAVGCQRATASPPEVAGAVAAPPAAPPPLATVTLPPAPVPATFDVPALAEKVRPTVVNITTAFASQPAGGSQEDELLEQFFGGRGGEKAQPHRKRQALGTGFVIDPNGYIVTNAHVVEGASEVKVKLADEREFKATVVGRDPRLDIALLKIDGVSNLPAAPLGQSEPLRVGESVMAVGNPYGLGHTVTLGIVSAKARAIGAGPYDDFIQTDASINPGNSGGPLFNWRGEVIGINTAIRPGANSIGFAIPIDPVKNILAQLREKGHVDRGKLGLMFQPVSADLATALGLDGETGALVSDVVPNGAAARAGIHAGEVVTAIDGTPIRHAEDLPRRVASHQPGEQIKVTVVGNKKVRDVTAKLDALQDEDDGSSGSPKATPSKGRAPAPTDKIGIKLSDAPNGAGVVVEDVADDSEVKDLHPGDVIVEMNNAPVHDTVSLRAAVAKVKPGSTVLAKVRRGRIIQYAAIPVPAR